MPVLRRVGLFGVVPLVVIAVAAFGWYRLSDTGRDWRYRDRLAGFCQGLVPEAESAVFTGHEESRLGRDRHVPEHDGLRWEQCKVAGLSLVIGDVADTVTNDGDAAGFLTLLHRGSAEQPVALGGGWEGYTDLRNTAVVLPCADRRSSVLVAADSDEALAGPAEARQAARLVTATAVRAARHYGCDAKPGGAVPPVPRPDGETVPENVTGTCAASPSRPPWTGARSTGSRRRTAPGRRRSRSASSARPWPSPRRRTTSTRTSARTRSGCGPSGTTADTAATVTAPRPSPVSTPPTPGPPRVALGAPHGRFSSPMPPSTRPRRSRS
ncbi:hypothetical protein ACFQY7_50900 [Actinomadura luteofluorescens]|uniref:hypothetical protein n=1 Tax=Actinomadura luteofluorescens TaxID=46163 RepID=UPI003628D967